MTSNLKYYAVKVGRETGIFRTWDECQQATKGYSGAVYKKFASKQEAEAWLNEAATKPNLGMTAEEAGSSGSFAADYDVYTDGSFMGDRYSWAYVFVRDGEIVYEDSDVGKNPEAGAMRNVAGEIAAVLYAVKKAATLGARIRIHHDYAGIAHWVKGEWKANNPYTQLYVELMRKHQGLYEFVKVPAHSGNRFNDYVDQKAKAALEESGCSALEDIEAARERLHKQIAFVVEIDKLKEVFRQNVLIKSRRNENDAEHSWHLAIMAVLLSEYAAENVDLLRVIKMVLIHDLVEIDAGDTYCYDEQGYQDKEDREQKAAERLFKILPSDQAQEFYDLWLEFEAMETPDAAFAACLDRLEPFLLNYHTQGHTWKRPGVTSAKVYQRAQVMKKSAPLLWEYTEKLLEDAIDKGYLKR